MTLSEKLAGTRSQGEPAEIRRSMSILARSLYREIKAADYDDRAVIALATALVDRVASGAPSESS